MSELMPCFPGSKAEVFRLTILKALPKSTSLTENNEKHTGMPIYSVCLMVGF